MFIYVRYCDVTLDCKHELLWVQHWSPLVLTLFTSLTVAPPLFALTPEVGAAVHTGYVENGDAFQRNAAEVQSHAITLIEREEMEEKLDVEGS